MYSNSSLSAMPLWEWHSEQMRANRLLGPSPTRYSTTWEERGGREERERRGGGKRREREREEEEGGEEREREEEEGGEREREREEETLLKTKTVFGREVQLNTTIICQRQLVTV